MGTKYIVKNLFSVGLVNPEELFFSLSFFLLLALCGLCCGPLVILSVFVYGMCVYTF